jgi:putative oxidoreductase
MTFRIMNWASRLFLGGIFLYSGYIKFDNPLQFAATLTTYQLFPESLIPTIITYLPWMEMALGAMLVIGWKARYFGAVAVALLSMFIVVLTITYLRGIDAECGCFGPGDRISPLTLTRDALFLLPAIFLTAEEKIRHRWFPQSA